MSTIDQIQSSFTATSSSGISLIAQAAAGSSNNNDVTTSAQNTTGASFLIAMVACFSSPNVVTDSKTNTWQSLSLYGSMVTPLIQFFYVKNPVVGAGHTFTATGTATFPSISIAAFNQTDTSANADAENGADGVTPGAITPSVNGCLIMTGMGGTGADRNIAGGYTLLSTVDYAPGGHFEIGLAYKVQPVAASVNATWTGSNVVAATIAAFKPA